MFSLSTVVCVALLLLQTCRLTHSQQLQFDTNADVLPQDMVPEPLTELQPPPLFTNLQARRFLFPETDSSTLMSGGTMLGDTAQMSGDGFAPLSRQKRSSHNQGRLFIVVQKGSGGGGCGSSCGHRPPAHPKPVVMRHPVMQKPKVVAKPVVVVQPIIVVKQVQKPPPAHPPPMMKTKHKPQPCHTCGGGESYASSQASASSSSVSWSGK